MYKEVWGKIKVPLLVFSFIWGYLFCFSNLGVDFTDCGYSIQCSYEIWKFRTCISPACFLSYWAGGVWQMLSPVGKDLQWLYIGGIVLWGMIGVFVFLILKLIFRIPDYMLALATIGAFLTIPLAQNDLLIHYYTFPLLLTTVYCFVLVRIISGTKQQTFEALLLGLIFTGMVASRFPLISMIGIPIFYYVAKGLIKRTWCINRKAIIGFLWGCVVGAILIIALFHGFKCKALPLAVQSTQNTLDIKHIFYSLPWQECISNVILEIFDLSTSLIAVFMFFAVGWIVSRFPESPKTFAAFLIAAIVFSAFAFLVMPQLPAAVAYKAVQVFKLGLNGMAAVLVIGVLWNNRGRSSFFSQADIAVSSTNFLLITLTLFAVFLIFPIGTNCGALNHYHGLFLMMAILNVLIWNILKQANLFKHAYLFLVLLFFPIAGIICSLNYSYREHNRLSLNTIIDIPELRNIKTSEDRTEISDSYKKLKMLVHKKETLLVTDNNFLWNWLLDTKCFITWKENETLEKFMERPDVILPDCILLIKKSTRELADYADHLNWWKEKFLPQRYENVYSDAYCELYRKTAL